jgi:hypothetical protein
MRVFAAVRMLAAKKEPLEDIVIDNIDKATANYVDTSGGRPAMQCTLRKA